MPGLDERLVGGVVEVVAVGAHHDRSDRGIAHGLKFAVGHDVLRPDELDAGLAQAELTVGFDDREGMRT